MIQTEKFVRKPFYVEAIKVTEENMTEVATWCNGEVLTDAKDVRYIHVRVHRPLNPRQTQAYVGDLVLYAGTGYKVYTQRSFDKSFTSVWEDEKKPSFVSPRHAMEVIHNAAQPVQTAGEIVAELDAVGDTPENPFPNGEAAQNALFIEANPDQLDLLTAEQVAEEAGIHG